MDIQRPSKARARRIRAAIYGIVAVVAVSAITVALARLEPAAPTVDRGTLWPGTATRGPMLRQVRGTGTLVPEEIRWIPATSEGQIERVIVKPGSEVQAGTVLLELSNPQLKLAAQDAEWKLKAAEAELNRLTVQLKSAALQQQADAARVKADYEQARMRSDTDEELARKGLIADLNRKLSRVTADELANRNRIEVERLAFTIETTAAQLAVQKAQVEQFRAALGLARQQVADLSVRAGIAGVLQQVPVEAGQRVAAGTILAKVAEPGKLKAELRIAETQAKDIIIGQKASVDTRNGIVEGRVSRIDPAVEQGTVTVDVELLGALPTGARPDLSVDGTVEIERLDDVLYINRPVNGQPQSLVGLFKISEDGTTAARVQVRLGRSSVNTIEVVEGLNPGDQVILSDMSAWDAYDRVRLK
jgi:HlyD family secretion protein